MALPCVKLIELTAMISLCVRLGGLQEIEFRSRSAVASVWLK